MKQFDVIADYGRHLRSMELSDNTIVSYSRILNLFAGWLAENYSVSINQPDEIKGYMVSMYCTSIQPMKISTRTLYLTTIRAWLKWLYSMQYVGHDLSSAVTKLPSIDKYNAAHPEEADPKRGYTPEEIHAMLTCNRRCVFTTHRDRAIIATMLATGLRVSELICLTVGDVLFEPEVLYVPRKGSHGQKLPVSIASSAYPYIREYIATREKTQHVDVDNPLWVSTTGKPLTRTEIWHSLSALQNKLGIHTGTHTMRHTMLTEVSKTADPVVARDAAGQKSISVTNRYLHTTRQDIQSAVEKAGALIRLTGELPSDTE